jgi:hypothetical protein
VVPGSPHLSALSLGEKTVLLWDFVLAFMANQYTEDTLVLDIKVKRCSTFGTMRIFAWVDVDRCHTTSERSQKRLRQNSRGSRFCIARCRSLSRSLRISFSFDSLPSSIRNPPFELTIFERSYSKYFPSLASRRSGLSFSLEGTGWVGDFESAAMGLSGRLLLGLGFEVEATACCSFSLCRAFAESVVAVHPKRRRAATHL